MHALVYIGCQVNLGNYLTPLPRLWKPLSAKERLRPQQKGTLRLAAVVSTVLRQPLRCNHLATNPPPLSSSHFPSRTEGRYLLRLFQSTGEPQMTKALFDSRASHEKKQKHSQMEGLGKRVKCVCNSPPGTECSQARQTPLAAVDKRLKTWLRRRATTLPKNRGFTPFRRNRFLPPTRPPPSRLPGSPVPPLLCRPSVQRRRRQQRFFGEHPSP